MIVSGKKTAAEDALLLFIAIFKDTKIEMLIVSFNALIKAFRNCLRQPILNLLNKKTSNSIPSKKCATS